MFEVLVYIGLFSLMIGGAIFCLINRYWAGFIFQIVCISFTIRDVIRYRFSKRAFDDDRQDPHNL